MLKMKGWTDFDELKMQINAAFYLDFFTGSVNFWNPVISSAKPRVNATWYKITNILIRIISQMIKYQRLLVWDNIIVSIPLDPNAYYLSVVLQNVTRDTCNFANNSLASLKLYLNYFTQKRRINFV